MSSTSTTEFYGLTQYVGSDKPSFLDNNEAFAAVDAALHGAVSDVASQGETISGLSAAVGGLGETVTGLSNSLDTEKGKIVALQDKEVLQDGAIAAVKADALDMVCAYNEEAATSTHAYAIGDYFRYNDVLYKATSAIAIGDTIVPNVNCEATNVSAELLEIISDIPSGVVAASSVTYDNTSSSLTADDVQEAIDELELSLENLPSMDTINVICNETVGTSSVNVVLTSTPDNMMYFIASQGDYVRSAISIPAYVWANAGAFSKVQLAWNNHYINIERTDATHLTAISDLIDARLFIYSM